MSIGFFFWLVMKTFLGHCFGGYETDKLCTLFPKRRMESLFLCKPNIYVRLNNSTNLCWRFPCCVASLFFLFLSVCFFECDLIRPLIRRLEIQISSCVKPWINRPLCGPKCGVETLQQIDCFTSFERVKTATLSRFQMLCCSRLFKWATNLIWQFKVNCSGR